MRSMTYLMKSENSMKRNYELQHSLLLSIYLSDRLRSVFLSMTNVQSIFPFQMCVFVLY